MRLHGGVRERSWRSVLEAGPMGSHFARGRNALGSVIATVLLAGVSVLACAKGDAPDFGAAGEETAQQPTEPAAPSQQLPPSTPGTEQDSGETSSSGGVDAGGDAAKDAGALDAAPDAAKDASVDAGGACAVVPPSNACGLAPQCGCAANQTCDVSNNTTGAVSCVLAGGGTLGTYCTSTAQCAKGFTCGYNTCRPYCATAGTACIGAGLGQCAQYYDPSAGTAVPNSKVCSITCDLRNATAACGSNNCIFDTTINVTDCDKSGTKVLFDPCTRYNDCAQGLACVQHPVFGLECEKWCRIGQNDCGLFESCTNVYGAAAPSSGGVKLGHCQ
jgi:hypothetical protein